MIGLEDCVVLFFNLFTFFQIFVYIFPWLLFFWYVLILFCWVLFCYFIFCLYCFLTVTSKGYFHALFPFFIIFELAFNCIIIIIIIIIIITLIIIIIIINNN